MSDEYYIQANGFVGNSMLWWKVGNCGYSTDIKEARIFTEAEAKQIVSSPHSDKKMWPKAYIDARISQHIDMQDCNHENALAV